MPAALSGPKGLHCRRQCPGERPYTSAPLSFGLCPLPCPAQEACVAGGSAPGRGHTQQRPLALGCARSLVRPKRPALQETVPRGEVIHISAPWSLGCARRHVWSGRSALPGTVPRGEAIHISAPLSLGSARCLFRPIFLCYSLYHAPGLFPCFFILPLAGPAHKPPSLRTCRNKPGAV